MDNYNIRSLLGERAFNMPVGSVTSQHRERAEQLLLSVDVLLDSGSAASDYFNLHVGLGWEFGLEAEHSRRTAVGSAATASGLGAEPETPSSGSSSVAARHWY